MSHLPYTHQITYAYVAPKPAPNSGATWDSSDDWPGVECTVAIPGLEMGKAYICMDYVATDTTVCGEELNGQWGFMATDRTAKQRQKTFRGATLKDAELQARAWGEEADRLLRGVIDRRNARLAQRRETIDRAHSISLTVEPPQEEESKQ